VTVVRARESEVVQQAGDEEQFLVMVHTISRCEHRRECPGAKAVVEKCGITKLARMALGLAGERSVWGNW
jgi:hypothetical protein